MKTKNTKNISKSKAKARAWKVFSLFIRQQASNDMGMVQCYTCIAFKHYKEMQAGHWIAGHGNAVYINEDYVRPQCYSCNVKRHGMQGEFRDRIRLELGDKVVDELILESNQFKDLTTEDYLELERYYKSKNENNTKN